jgi:hypothetical protein
MPGPFPWNDSLEEPDEERIETRLIYEGDDYDLDAPPFWRNPKHPWYDPARHGHATASDDGAFPPRTEEEILERPGTYTEEELELYPDLYEKLLRRGAIPPDEEDYRRFPWLVADLERIIDEHIAEHPERREEWEKERAEIRAEYGTAHLTVDKENT